MAFGQVGIGTETPDASSILDVTSTTAGVLVPRMLESERMAIASPATGLLVYQTDSTTGFWFFDGSSWTSLSSPPSNTSWNITGNSGTDTSTDFIGTTDNQDLVFKRNNIQIGKLSEDNVSFGENALSNSVVGGSNIAIGKSAMQNNVTPDNIAIGTNALAGASSVGGNIAIGTNALQSTPWNKNIAIGNNALSTNTERENIAIGYDALKDNTTGRYNVAVGVQSLERNTTAFSSTSMGYQTLQYHISGGSNSAFGYKALNRTTSGFANSALGSQALEANTTGTYNTANGYRALYSNQTGQENSAFGYNALQNNTAGSYNTAMGALSLRFNQADYNTAIGYYSLLNNVTGVNNIAMGYRALGSNNIGSNNTALGHRALDGASECQGCTAVGSLSLYVANNVANSTSLGYEAFSVSTSSGGPFSNSTAIGYDAEPGAANTIRLGNSSVNAIGGYANWSNVSDGRFKNNVKENVIGLDFILKLRPVTYNLDMEAIARFKNTPNSLRLREAEQLKRAEVQNGFIAQEVELAALQSGFDFHGVDKPKNENSHYGLRYAEFVVPLVKAMQEQQEIIEDQKNKIEDLELQLQRIEAMIKANLN